MVGRIFGTALCASLVILSMGRKGRAAVDNNMLKGSLSRYCIPTSDCSKQAAVNWSATSGNRCECANSEKYYDTSTRQCESCANGYISRYKNSSGTTSTGAVSSGNCEPVICPAGSQLDYTRRQIGSYNCQAGTQRITYFTPSW